MTSVGDGLQPARAWGVAAVPNRTATNLDTVEPDPEREPSPPSGPAGARHRATDGDPNRDTSGDTGLETGIDEAGEWLGSARPPNGHKRRSRFWTGLRTAVVVVTLIAGAAIGGTYLLRQRVAAAAFLDLGTVTLTADPVPIGFADAVVVVSVSVTEQARVSAEQELAKVRTATNEVYVLRAPSAGAVASVIVGPGGLVRGGEPVLMLYDPEQTTFQAEVAVESLQRLRIGMTAQISGPGLPGPITATLDRVLPVMNSRPTGVLTVVLTPSPEHRSEVAKLLPGLPFKATVDTNSAGTAVPAVNGG